MSTRLRPTSEGSKKVWNHIRNKARTPLHKLISYGELISEEISGTDHEPIQQQISKLLTLCEAAVARTHENVDGRGQWGCACDNFVQLRDRGGKPVHFPVACDQ